MKPCQERQTAHNKWPVTEPVPDGPAESAPTMMLILDHRNAMANVDGGKRHWWISDGTAQVPNEDRSRLHLHERTQNSDAKL